MLENFDVLHPSIKWGPWIPAARCSIHCGPQEGLEGSGRGTFYAAAELFQHQELLEFYRSKSIGIDIAVEITIKNSSQLVAPEELITGCDSGPSHGILGGSAQICCLLNLVWDMFHFLLNSRMWIL